MQMAFFSTQLSLGPALCLSVCQSVLELQFVFGPRPSHQNLWLPE